MGLVALAVAVSSGGVEADKIVGDGGDDADADAESGPQS
jgi:hypothetical protein